MLDTNICIYVLKEHPQKVYERFRKFNEQLYISSIVYSELQYGIEISPARIKTARQDQLWDFISLLKILPWEQTAAVNYAKIRAVLKTEGKLIGNMDMLIAAHALSTQSVLVTNNMKEFSRIPELALENWVD